MTYYAASIDASGELLQVCTAARPDSLGVIGAHPDAHQVIVSSDEPPADAYWGGSSWIVKPAQPSPSHEWDAALKLWADPRELAQMKSAKRAEVKARRELEIDRPKTTSLGQFDAKPADQDNLNKVIALTALAVSRGFPDEARYTLATNERVTFTLAELQTAALEIGQQTQAIYDIADGLYALIESAEAAAQLEGIAWPTS